MDNNEFLECEVRWLMTLSPDTPISACIPQEIVKVLMELLKLEIEAGRIKPMPQVSRSRNQRVPVSKVPDNSELLGNDREPR